jgi:hypothetical protein
MRRVIILLGLLIAAALAGCASSAAEIKAGLDPWVGERVEDLVGHWGAPSQVANIRGGYQVYTYFRSSSPVTYGTYTPYANMVTVQTVQSGCRVDWTVDPRGIVRNYHVEGSCKIQ